MTLFSIIAALMLLLALAIMLPALLGKYRSKPSEQAIDRDYQNIGIIKDNLNELESSRAAGRITEQEYQAVRQEMEALLLAEVDESSSTVNSMGSHQGRWVVIPVVIAIPVLSIWIYSLIGNPASFDADLAAASQMQSNQGSPGTPEEMVARLAEKMEENPDNIQGWLMLGQSYKVMKRFDDAVYALKHAMELEKDQPDIMLQYADALAAQNDSLQGEPSDIIERALVLAPDHVTALWLGGMVAADQGNYGLALNRWQRALPLLAEEPEIQNELREYIKMAEARLSGDSAQGANAEASQQNSVADVSDENQSIASATIRLNVSIAEDQQANVASDDSVYIFAQALSGPPMPLAVAKHQVRDLPLTVELNDSMAMMPELKLSNFKEVRIVARVSKTGQAIAQPGDLQGSIASVEVAGDDPVAVVIDSVVP